MAVAEVTTPAESRPQQTSSTRTPHLVAPTDGASVEGSALTFEWEPVADATRYQLQVSTDAAFDDVEVSLPLQDTTSLTVYSLLPEDGETYYWRVQAGTDEQWFGWSEPETLTSVSDADAAAYEARRETKSPPPSPHTATADVAAQQEAAAVPFQNSATSFTQTFLFFLLFLLGMALIAYLIVLGYDTRLAATSGVSAGVFVVPLVRMLPRSA